MVRAGAMALGLIVALAPQHATKPVIDLQFVPHAPSPVAQSVPRRAAFTLVAANIRAYPPMSRAAYRHDIRRLARIRGRKAVLGAEIERPAERRLWHALWRRHGYRVVHLEQETTQALDARRIRVRTSVARRYARSQPGPASPARWYVLTRADVRTYRVAFLSLHLTNGCFPGKRARWWYAARCRAHHWEVRRIRRLVADLHASGWSVVVGGDMNTHHPIVWGTRQRSRATGLLQLAVVPARGVAARLTRFRVVRRLHTDHDAPVVHVTLTRRYTR